jgi:hypothetical protein
MTIRVLVAAAALLTGCMEEKRTPVDYTERIERTSVSAADTAGRPAPVAPTAQDPPATMPGSTSATSEVTLAPLTGGRVHGLLRLRGNGGSTIIDAALTAERGAGTYDGAIHLGECRRLGSRVAALIAVSIDSAGTGRSATFVPLPIDTLLARRHAVVFGRGGRPDSCGDVGVRT